MVRTRSAARLAARENLLRCALAACDCAMDGTSVSKQIGGFTCKIYGIRNGLGELAASGEPAGRNVAVGAPRIRVGMPIVEESAVRRQLGASEGARERGARALDHCVGADAEQRIRFWSGAPACDDARLEGAASPPDGEERLIGEEESGVTRGGRIVPEGMVEQEGDAE